MSNMAIVVENFIVHRDFGFAIPTLQTFPKSRKCKNFNFSLYTVPAEMLYLQKYLTRFTKTFFWLKDEEGGYWGWKLYCAQMLRFCNSNVTTFPKYRKCKNFNLSPLHCPGRNAISSKVFYEFSKTFSSTERWEMWLLWLKIFSAQRFWFCNTNVTTFPKYRKCKNFNFSLYTVPAVNAISSKVFNEFTKTFFRLKDEEGGYWGWKFLVHRYFGFAIATLQLSQNPENVKISIFPFTLSRQKCCIFKSILQIFKNILFAER